MDCTIRRIMFRDTNDNQRARDRKRLRRLIEALRGELTVQGILGQGTTTNLRIDLVSLAETAIMVFDASERELDGKL